MAETLPITMALQVNDDDRVLYYLHSTVFDHIINPRHDPHCGPSDSQTWYPAAPY